MHIGQIITHYRKRNRMTIDQLVEASGIPKGTLNKIISGDTKDPQLDTVIALAKALGITLDQFDPDNEPDKISQEEHRLIADFRLLDKRGKQTISAMIREELRFAGDREGEPEEKLMLPVYVFPAAAGIPIFADNDFDDMDFPADQVPKGADFGIRISGDSMEPTIPDGTIVFVKKTGELRIGEIGIFMIDDEAACKRFYMDQDGIQLQSDNEAHEPLRFNGFQRFTIVGKVLGYK